MARRRSTATAVQAAAEQADQLIAEAHPTEAEQTERPPTGHDATVEELAAEPDVFELDKVSQHGIAYYTRRGFKKTKWAIPSPHFVNGTPPKQFAVVLDPQHFATAPVDVKALLDKASPEKMAKVLALLNGDD